MQPKIRVIVAMMLILVLMAEPVTVKADAGQGSFGFVFRIIMTVLVELAIALLFGYKGKKAVKCILITNIITQIALNAGLDFGVHYIGPRDGRIFYMILEVMVFITEAIVYKQLILTQEQKKNWKDKCKIYGYSLVANLVSFGCGSGLALILPGLF